ncbi:hypothetical protein KSF78_0009479 [Schistosoma japonicum]|nr:hypothetical protein KSF78_0009479 [Schistosoma japonicum]KAH8857269.1 hypothetical protein KSF78_0009479 [Schistosoma japonicum]
MSEFHFQMIMLIKVLLRVFLNQLLYLKSTNDHTKLAIRLSVIMICKCFMVTVQ